MKKFLRLSFFIPVAYSLLSAALTLLFAAAIASLYTELAWTGAFFYHWGYHILAAFSTAAMASPLSLVICLLLSQHHRRKETAAGRFYREAPLFLSIVTQGILLAALLFFLLVNLF
ncbi:hypothetical protein [Cloacibacillus porcorum]|uniref:hypothetical protein n=1 Tax=Cloacibacillus porcorum TaxID=1197717 RepID=UPI002671D77A|nr:hypothetical protein [Cloacibacillus porcorum]